MDVHSLPSFAPHAGTHLSTHALLIRTILRMIQLKIPLRPRKKPDIPTLTPRETVKNQIQPLHPKVMSQLTASQVQGCQGMSIPNPMGDHSVLTIYNE